MNLIWRYTWQKILAVCDCAFHAEMGHHHRTEFNKGQSQYIFEI